MTASPPQPSLTTLNPVTSFPAAGSVTNAPTISAGGLVAAPALFTTIATTAGDLGTSLPLGTELVTGLGAASHVSGPVTPVANDTLPQLLAYISAHQGLA